jgi:hypothetical protein
MTAFADEPYQFNVGLVGEQLPDVANLVELQNSWMKLCSLVSLGASFFLVAIDDWFCLNYANCTGREPTFRSLDNSNVNESKNKSRLLSHKLRQTKRR